MSQINIVVPKVGMNYKFLYPIDAPIHQSYGGSQGER